MKQDEAEKLAAHILNSDDLWFWKAEIYRLCDHILSGDMKREIENAAYERAALAIEEMPAAMFSGDYDAAVKNRAFTRNNVRSLIQPPAQKENGE